jgi:hypothetical protein
MASEMVHALGALVVLALPLILAWIIVSRQKK